MKKVVAVSTLLWGLTGCASPGIDMAKQAAEWASLSKEHFAQNTALKDDDLDTVATLNTINGHQFKMDRFGSIEDDDFFRAFVDKKTGKVTYQLYLVIRYEDSGWHYYNGFNYESPNGALSAPAEVVAREVDCSRFTYTKKCSYEEHVALNLDGDFMGWLASVYGPTKKVALKYKATSKSGNDRAESILAAEAAGLLDRVDAYLAAKGLPKR